jgi:hypothetical protein
MDPTVGLDTREKSLRPMPGIESQFLWRAARNPSLYPLSCIQIRLNSNCHITPTTEKPAIEARRVFNMCPPGFIICQ